MPNYKQCRFCSEKYVPQRNELICPKCGTAIVRAVSMPVGEPVLPKKQLETLAKTADIIKDIIISEAPYIKTAGTENLPPETEIKEVSPDPVQKNKLPVDIAAVVETGKPATLIIVPNPEELRKQKDVVDVFEPPKDIAETLPESEPKPKPKSKETIVNPPG